RKSGTGFRWSFHRSLSLAARTPARVCKLLRAAIEQVGNRDSATVGRSWARAAQNGLVRSGSFTPCPDLLLGKRQSSSGIAFPGLTNSRHRHYEQRSEPTWTSFQRHIAWPVGPDWSR